MTGDDAKLPLFHGNKTKDQEQYWFMCEVVWTFSKTADDEVKKGQMETTIRGCALDWFMKFVHVPTGTLVKTLAKVRKRTNLRVQKIKI